jgi:hypothetical protein
MTPEDEERFASALLAALGTLLDVFPIPYTLKIETSGSKVLHRTRPNGETVPAGPNRFERLNPPR